MCVYLIQQPCALLCVCVCVCVCVGVFCVCSLVPLVQCLLTVSSSGEAVGVPVWTIVANELSVTMVSVVVSIEVVLVLVGSSKKEEKKVVHLRVIWNQRVQIFLLAIGLQ